MDGARDAATIGLIGRDRERSELRALIGRSRVVFVYGAAGIGKTSLVLDVCREASRAGTLPEVVHLSLAAVADSREALERTAKAMAAPRPTPPPERLDDALGALLASAPRTVVWDDIDERSPLLAEMVRRFAALEGPARIVLVSRRFFTSREVTMRTPTFEVKPLAHEDAVRLVRAVEAARGRTLADDLAEATGGNPLLLRIALAQGALPHVATDATDALRHAFDERAGSKSGGVTRKVLALLSAAETPLAEEEVARAAGKGAADAIDGLRKHLLVVREGHRIALAPPVAAIARKQLGDIDDATWRSLTKIAERALVSSAHDDAALVLAARAYLELGDVERALAITREHAIARAAAPTAVIERLLRDVAAREPAAASVALRLLARELLRVGDYEAARRTLDDLPPPKTRDEAERVALLRAESHIRAGEPAAAQHALDALARAPAASAKGAKGPKGGKDAKVAKDAKDAKDAKAPASENVGIVLTRAQLAVLRGELEAARAILEGIAGQTSEVPQLEARRVVEIAASHLYEERYDLTHEYTARARSAQRAAGIPVERVVTILDVHALLGLGEVDRAEDAIARETRGGPDVAVLEIAALVRRGDHTRALEVGDAAIAALDRRADLLLRSVLARDLVRACIGTGQFGRAEKMLRLAEAAADEPGMAAMRPICDAERARLAEAEGDLARAKKLIEKAHACIPASPFVAIDRDVLARRKPALLEAETTPVARAYASLRAAELALATGALDDALEAADVAERYHATARLWHETARARLAKAEVLVRLQAEPSRGERERRALLERAEQVLSACDEIASFHGYVPILVGSALVRATMLESAGELEAAARAMSSALAAAGETMDSALARAASRLGITVREPRGEGAARRAYAAFVERLGLLRSAEVVWRVGGRSYLAQSDDPPPVALSCIVDMEERCVRAGDDRRLELPEQRILLLAVLAEAGETGASLEEIFARVWGGTFHPLRHRNAVYVALARLKESLKPFARDVRVTHDGDRYRLTGPLPVGVLRRA
ncbi:MAG: AAA family ATPase [Deltaproteobacteria bacterium]|nr:AAA family ATPase [Deltaproteobacteria bacterium]